MEGQFAKAVESETRAVVIRDESFGRVFGSRFLGRVNQPRPRSTPVPQTKGPGDPRQGRKICCTRERCEVSRRPSLSCSKFPPEFSKRLECSLCACDRHRLPRQIIPKFTKPGRCSGSLALVIRTFALISIILDAVFTMRNRDLMLVHAMSLARLRRPARWCFSLKSLSHMYGQAASRYGTRRPFRRARAGGASTGSSPA